MKENLLKIINEVLIRKELNTISELHSQLDLRKDLGMDSIDLAFLTVLIEERYGVDIFADGVSTSVGDIINKINE